jgi:hypothetical protein
MHVRVVVVVVVDVVAVGVVMIKILVLKHYIRKMEESAANHGEIVNEH